MTTALVQMYSAYQQFLEDNIDPRTKDYPLVGNPVYVILIVIGYNYFVTDFGPKFMKDRPAYKLKGAMIIYNALQVLVNAWIVKVAILDVWVAGSYDVLCHSVEYSEKPVDMLVAHMIWIYYMTKLIDLIDTVFMVLKKNTRQISFLHKYHHMGMCLAGYVGAAFVGGGSQVVFFGTVNCIVHTIMYSYYLLTILYPEYKQSSFKRRITEMQLVQFVLTFLQASAPFFLRDCNFPLWLLAIFIPQDVFMFALFWDFYVKTYLKPKKQNKAKKGN